MYCTTTTTTTLGQLVITITNEMYHSNERIHTIHISVVKKMMQIERHFKEPNHQLQESEEALE